MPKVKRARANRVAQPNVQDAYDPIQEDRRRHDAAHDAGMSRTLSPSDALEAYLLSLPGDTKPNTIRHKRAHLGQLVRWMEDSERHADKSGKHARPLGLADMDILHMRRYLAWRATVRKASDTTRYHDATQARVFFDFCRSAGWIRTDPLAGIKVRKPKQKPTELATPEQIAAIKRAVLEYWYPEHTRGAMFASDERCTFTRRRDWAILLMFLHAGARCDELWKVTMNDLRINGDPATYQSVGNALAVHKAAKRAKSPLPRTPAAVTYRDTKTGVDRAVPVSWECLAALYEWLAVRPRTPHPNLFVTLAGTKLSVSNWDRHFKLYTTRAGCPHVTTQWLRRDFIMSITDRTGNVKVAAQLAGNSVDVIMRHYDRQRQETLTRVWEEAFANDDAAPDMLVATHGERARRAQRMVR